jgi:hypothetical protein
MALTELLIKAEKDDTLQPFSKNFDQYGNSSEFIFDVSLSTAVAADGKNEERAPNPKGPLSPEMLDKMNRYWRAANYLCIGQIYLFENPLLRSPLKAEQIKPSLLGHWYWGSQQLLKALANWGAGECPHYFSGTMRVPPKPRFRRSIRGEIQMTCIIQVKSMPFDSRSCL